MRINRRETIERRVLPDIS